MAETGQAPGLGFMTAHRLLSAFGSPAAVFDAGAAQLAGLVGDKLASALLAPPSPAVLALIDKTLAWAGTGRQPPADAG